MAELEAHRIEGIDVAKGIGILLVVSGHLCGPGGTAPGWLGAFQRIIYQFHVPLFFFLSGMFFRETEGWGGFLRKKIRRLYVPFVVANLVFLVLDELLRYATGVRIVPADELKHGMKVVLMMANSPMGGATWFLRSLLVCSIVYKAVWTLAGGRWMIVFPACAALSACGMWAPSSYSLSATMMAMGFYCIGHMSSGRISSAFSLGLRPRLLVFMACALLLVLAAPSNRFDSALGIYGNRLLAIPMAAIGITCTLALSSLAGKGAVSGILGCVGKNTMCVLVGHMAAFKLVIALQMLLTGLPISAILSHPCHEVSGCWWILYLTMGVCLPILVCKCLRKRSSSNG